MENDHCLNRCPIGQEYKRLVLEDDDSVFDAVWDCQRLIDGCRYTCPRFDDYERRVRKDGN